MNVDWNEITPFERPEDSPGFILWRLSNTWQRAIRAALAPHGLTHVQFVLLATLSWLESHDWEPITQRKLADHADTDVMMTSQVVRALEKAGYIARQAHPTDTRALVVTVTDAGRKKVQEALPDVEAVDRAFFAKHRSDLGKLSK